MADRQQVLDMPRINSRLSRTGWRKVRFGDVVRNVNVNERNPLENGLERYIGIEHIDPEDLHVKRWGMIEDGTSFTRTFTKGQVLFPKRRVYQRKVAVAEFDGICSGDILVFEAKKDLIPELLPFIVELERFFAHALNTSAGSLSPRTKWKDLANYEFLLPPKDEQQRIAEILCTAEVTLRSFQDALIDAELAQITLLTELTTKGLPNRRREGVHSKRIPDAWRIVSLGDVLDICQYGLSVQMNDSGKYPIFRMMNIVDGVVIDNDMKYVDLPSEEFDHYQLKPGDILFNRTNSADLVGKVGIYRLSGDHVFASYLIRLRARGDTILPEYLNYYLNSKLGQARILAYATPGVSQTNINGSNLKKVMVPLPPIEEQVEIIEAMKAVDIAKGHLVRQQACLRDLMKSLSNRLLAWNQAGRDHVQ